MCCLAHNNSYKKFSSFEKAYARITFNAFFITGVYAIYKNNIIAGTSYILFVLIGILLIMRYWICPRCPHIEKYSDCLNLPYKGTVKIIKKYSSLPLNKTEKIYYILTLSGFAIIPQYWLAKNSKHLVIFWIFAILFYGGLLLHFCRKCLNTLCPLKIKK